MNSWARTFSLLAIGICVASCDDGPRYDVVDTPMAVPVEVEGPARPPDEAPDEPDPELVKQCVPGTGRNASGECEALRREDAGYAQRIQMPRGDFVMGDIPPSYDAYKTRKEPRSRWSGNPPRRADTQAFWIDLHEVTREAYEACVKDGKCTAAKCDEGKDPIAKYDAEELARVPQTCVTHEQAEQFCRARGGRLPTEAQWEYAARGPDARIYPWGNDFRDEYQQALAPVDGPVDVSYFGLRGMGTSAVEWVAEGFELDVGLSSFVSGPFRSANGPLRKAVAALEGAHVVKGGRAGARDGKVGVDPLLGFRCVADLAADQTPLDVPDPAALVPLVVDASPLLFFGGVAEVVDRDEAAKFCDVLRVDLGTGPLEDWRLPTLDEIVSSSAVFRGPGPFWTQEGAAEQRGDKLRAKPDDPWVDIQADPDEGLAARCVRGS